MPGVAIGPCGPAIRLGSLARPVIGLTPSRPLNLRSKRCRPRRMARNGSNAMTFADVFQSDPGDRGAGRYSRIARPVRNPDLLAKGESRARVAERRPR
jgi:hypothetical protein